MIAYVRGDLYAVEHQRWPAIVAHGSRDPTFSEYTKVTLLWNCRTTTTGHKFDQASAAVEAARAAIENKPSPARSCRTARIAKALCRYRSSKGRKSPAGLKLEKEAVTADLVSRPL